MAYVVIEDFRAGLDKRKMEVSAAQGSLQTLTNAHITRGGEIEKRKAWVAKYALPPGQTFGFAGADGNLYVFGSAASPVVPAGVTYQQLLRSPAVDMKSVIDTEFYDGKLFVAADYDDDLTVHFYDATQVADWDSGSGATQVEGQEATSLLTVKSKVYATYGSILAHSAVGEPTEWKDTAPNIVGSGIINMSNQSAGSETLIGLGRYQSNIAVFARRNIQIWFVDPDPLQNAQRQVLPEIGTFAKKSIVSFGDIDVFFLSDTGVRSLRSRDSSNQAGVNDVGTPIDDEVIDYLRSLTAAEKAAAVAVMDPLDGRYVLSIAGREYAFSYFPGSKVSAWSRYDSGFVISDFVAMNGQLWARSADTIYLYGGDDGITYDDSRVEVEIPYIDGRMIATWKSWTGLDVVCEGEWTVQINTDPRRPDFWSDIAIVRGTTINELDIGMVASSPVLKLRLINERDGAAKLSKIIVHYQAAQAS